MNLYRSESSDPKTNAQRNLCGRTHYVDEDTLRFHKSRVLSAGITDQGLLFWIVTSDALTPDGRRRGFRYVIFDVFGTVLARPDTKDAWKSHASARKAMRKALDSIDAVKVTFEAIERHRAATEREMVDLSARVDAIRTKREAA